jgi:hypothetical protein
MIERTRRRPDLTANPAWGPWGVQLAGYERLRRKYSAVLGDRLPLVLDGRRRAASPFLVRVSEESRPAANALCAKLVAAGGNCTVFRNPRNGVCIVIVFDGEVSAKRYRSCPRQRRPAASLLVTFPESTARTRRLCLSA